MTINELLNHFKNLTEVCNQLGISPQNVTKWRNKGYIPLLQQYRIAELTDGALMPDEIDPKTLKKEHQ